MAAPKSASDWLAAMRAEDWERILTGVAPRADAVDERTRELVLLAVAVTAGDAARAERAIRAARVLGIGEDLLLDTVLLAASAAGAARALPAAELLMPAGAGGEWVVAGALGDLPDGGGREVKVGGKAIALLRKGENVTAIQAYCPHMRGPLAEGYREGNEITCPLHAWTFDLSSGECRGVPGAKIAIYPVRVEGQSVLIQL